MLGVLPVLLSWLRNAALFMNIPLQNLMFYEIYPAIGIEIGYNSYETKFASLQSGPVAWPSFLCDGLALSLLHSITT